MASPISWIYLQAVAALTKVGSFYILGDKIRWIRGKAKTENCKVVVEHIESAWSKSERYADISESAGDAATGNTRPLCRCPGTR